MLRLPPALEPWIGACFAPCGAMTALYPRWANMVYRVVLVLLVLGAVAAVLGPWIYVRTPYNTQQFNVVGQPVEFDHRHHVRDDGIDCIYCHQEVETSANAGVPSTDLCMGCHAQIWNNSPHLEIVRRSYFSGAPIPWNRVHDLADFVYFNHSVHVNYGIECEQCHGDVSEMARPYVVQPLTMGWCIDCHREPEERIGRSREPETASAATAQMLFQEDLFQDREVTSLITCTACHR